MIAVSSTFSVRIAARAMQSALAVLQKAHTSELLVSAMLDWDERQRLTRMDHWATLDEDG